MSRASDAWFGLTPATADRPGRVDVARVEDIPGEHHVDPANDIDLDVVVPPILAAAAASHPGLLEELATALRWNGQDTGPLVSDLVLPTAPVRQNRPPRRFRTPAPLFREAHA